MEIGHRKGERSCYGNLRIVSQSPGEYDKAQRISWESTCHKNRNWSQKNNQKRFERFTSKFATVKKKRGRGALENKKTHRTEKKINVALLLSYQY